MTHLMQSLSLWPLAGSLSPLYSPSQPGCADGEPHSGIYPTAGRHTGRPGEVPQPGPKDRPPHRSQHPLRPGRLRGEHGDVHAPPGKSSPSSPACVSSGARALVTCTVPIHCAHCSGTTPSSRIQVFTGILSHSGSDPLLPTIVLIVFCRCMVLLQWWTWQTKPMFSCSAMSTSYSS